MLSRFRKGRVSKKINGIEIKLNGFVADTTNYYYETSNEKEALYLVSLLNSPFVNSAIKGMQARGLFGPRHVHKKVLELSYPKFDDKNELHSELANLAKKYGKNKKRIAKHYREIFFNCF